MGVVPERFSLRGVIPPWVRHEHLARYLFAAAFVSGKRVVDCACGNGQGTALLLQAGAASVAAFDRSEEAVAATRARCGRAMVRAAVCDAAALPLPDRMAECFICLETIEHAADDRALLAEAARVLTPDGLFLCSTPNRTVTNPGSARSDRPWNPFHAREYAPGEFAERLGSAFRQIEWHGQNPVSRVRVQALGAASAILPRHGAVRVHQLMKWPGLIRDRLSDHMVQRRRAEVDYEYLVAVCRRPVTPPA